MMNKVAIRLNKTLTALKENVASVNKENTNEVQLCPDKSAVNNLELKEQETTLKHHQDIANGINTIVNVCNSSAASDWRVTLSKHNVKFKGLPFECDCCK